MYRYAQKNSGYDTKSIGTLDFLVVLIFFLSSENVGESSEWVKQLQQ